MKRCITWHDIAYAIVYLAYTHSDGAKWFKWKTQVMASNSSCLIPRKDQQHIAAEQFVEDYLGIPLYYCLTMQFVGRCAWLQIISVYEANFFLCQTLKGFNHVTETGLPPISNTAYLSLFLLCRVIRTQALWRNTVTTHMPHISCQFSACIIQSFWWGKGRLEIADSSTFEISVWFWVSNGKT